MPGARSTRPPYALLAAAAASVALLRAAAGPIRDVDYFWHLLVGQDVLAGIGVAAAGQGWSFAPVADSWVSTQWLAEVLFAALEGPFGLSSALVYRVVTTAAVLATLAWATLHHRPLRSGAWVFTIVVAQVAIATQERSQQLTFLLAPVVGLWALRLWRDGDLPRWWAVLPLVWVWSQFHGGWVLVPLLLLLASCARALDRRGVDRAIAGAALLAAGSGLVALLSPAGLGTITAARRFAAAAEGIVEWQPVELWSWTSLPLAGLVLVVVVAWSRASERPSTGELLLVIVLCAFALSAYRNVAPAMLVLAPFVVGILARALGEPDPVVDEPVRPRLAGPAWALTLGAGALALAVAATTPSVVDPGMAPARLLDRIADAGGQRVLNAYNVSGPLLWFAGPPPDVLVAIDGRADRYGADYLGRYADLEAGRSGWESLVDELRPTSALISQEKALAELLRARGWVEVDREGGYVLLHAPGATGWEGQPATEAR